jgi:hypothetical protein
MKLVGVLAIGLLLVSCGDGDGDGKIDTAEECQEAGGRVVPGIGPSPICEADEEQIGSIQPGGYEGTICCREK